MRKTLLNTSIVAIIFTLLSIGAFAKDFDFKGKFGFDFSSTPEFVYSTLSKKYANEIVQQKVELIVSTKKPGNRYIALDASDTLKDFFNAISIYIRFDESQRIESIRLDYCLDSDFFELREDSQEEFLALRLMINQFLVVHEIAEMCDRIEPGTLEDNSFLHFSNCTIFEVHSLKDNLFAIKFERIE